MTTFFTILFVLFLMALVAVGLIIYKAYSAMRRLKRKFGIGGRSSSRPSRRDREAYSARNSGGRRGRSRRIIPPEYAVDVEYEILELTGHERFLRIEDVLSGRGEAQISDVEYKVVFFSQAEV